MARGNPFQRPRQPRIVARQIIIVCEGKKTEYEYFREMRKDLRIPKELVTVVHPNSTDPRSIVEEAVGVMSRRKAEKAWTAEDKAWAVFDGDEHFHGNRGNWDAALQMARSRGIGLAISNPCFELWYLLHYQDQTAHLSSHDALRLLRYHLGKYEKSDKLWPKPLQLLTDEAIRRAKQLARRAEADDLPPHTNPCTGVCELVESLLALAKEMGR